nr:hypothetical protein [Actinomadura madurae]
MTGQPAAQANAAFFAATAVGAFQGASTTAGPRGRRCSRTVRPSVPRSSGISAPMRSAAPRSVSPSEPANSRVIEIGTPESPVSCPAISGASWSSRSAAARSAEARCPGEPRPPVAARWSRQAAASARSTRSCGVSVPSGSAQTPSISCAGRTGRGRAVMRALQDHRPRPYRR